jgi:hypothetical protein
MLHRQEPLDADPLVIVLLLGGHGVQRAAPDWVAYDPVEQALQAVSPVVPANAPALHALQTGLPVVLAKVPAIHAWHADAAVAPVPVENVPVPH